MVLQVENLSRTLTFHFDGSLWNFWIHFVISRSQPLEKIEFSLCNLKLSEETLGDWDVSLFSLKLGDVLLLDLTKALIILPLMRLWFVASLSHISRLCAMSLLADFGFECYKVNNQCQLNQQNSMCVPLKENHWICSRDSRCIDRTQIKSELFLKCSAPFSVCHVSLSAPFVFQVDTSRTEWPQTFQNAFEW